MNFAAILTHTPIIVLVFEGALILALMFIVGDLIPMIWKRQLKAKKNERIP